MISNAHDNLAVDKCIFGSVTEFEFDSAARANQLNIKVLVGGE